MTNQAAIKKPGRRNASVLAGRLSSPVVIVVLAVLAALAVFLRQYR
jgi:hypothetical protein